MRIPSRLAGAAAFAGLLLSAGLLWGWTHKGCCVDMGLHYALVEFIREHLSWPTPTISYMGEVSIYPPLSHSIAAALALLTGSSFFSLHLVSTASAVIALAMLFVLVRFRSANATLVATGIIAAVMAMFEHR